MKLFIERPCTIRCIHFARKFVGRKEKKMLTDGVVKVMELLRNETSQDSKNYVFYLQGSNISLRLYTTHQFICNGGTPYGVHH